MKNVPRNNTYLLILIFFFHVVSANSQISFEQILKNPNDLKINLKYAKEQEDLGNFKSVISTLERLTSLYPENIDLKMYYLSISLRIDSVERTIQIIDEIKNSEQLTAEINAEIDIILQNLNNTANANENKWNGYIDVSLSHTYHTNINNLSDSGTFYVSDSISNYATNEIENDTLEIPSIRIGGFKKLSDNSNINLNIGLSDTYQNKDKSEEKDLNSVFLNHNYFKDKNLLSITFSFNKSNYRNQADINTINFGLRDKYSINKNHFLIGGINYMKNTYNQNNTFSTTREKNNYFVSGNVGYEFILSNNKFLFDYKDGESKAIADQYGYKQEKYLISYSRYFDFGTFNLSKSFTENEYEIADTFVLSNTIRDDELDTTLVSLNGELINLYFLNKFKFFKDVYYNLSFSKIDSTSNILNYNYEKEIHNVGLTKRINF
jgi:hypothetical protein